MLRIHNVEFLYYGAQFLHYRQPKNRRIAGRLPEVFRKRNPARQEQGGEQNIIIITTAIILLLVIITLRVLISNY